MQNSIILLRPAISAHSDEVVCQSMGWQSLLVEYQKLQPIAARLSELPRLSFEAEVIFWVSPAAVHLAAPYIPDKQLHQHVAVGQATGRILQSYGFEHVLYPETGNDSQAVWQLPLWHQQRGRLLCIGAETGRTWLAEKLRGIGWQVDMAEVYQRIPQSIDWSSVLKLKQHTLLRAVYVTTCAAVTLWFEQLPADLHTWAKSLIYLSHHPRVHQSLIQHDVQSILISDLHHGLTLLPTASE
ncbi:uroporphyrinogen-III synthase [Neisseriaceae bacterium ESL0693]|nr:uroporphyrinogen-III synthase [Neisseriaceae bacterium ESL0693]